jgi:hypothetical protein
MDSSITAIRLAGGSPGILDGFSAREPFDDDHVGSHGLGIGRSSSLKPSNPEAAGAWPAQGDHHGPQEEVVLPQLWFRLSEKDRACFGGCFSQMVLRVLRGVADGAGGDEA